MSQPENIEFLTISKKQFLNTLVDSWGCKSTLVFLKILIDLENNDEMWRLLVTAYDSAYRTVNNQNNLTDDLLTNIDKSFDELITKIEEEIKNGTLS